MTERAFKPGDRVEWGAMGRVVRGTIETVGTGKDDGLAMVRQDGYAKSHPVSTKRLSPSKVRTPWPMGGEDRA